MLDLLRDELLVALKLVGCSSPADVTRDRVQRQALPFTLIRVAPFLGD